MRVRVTRIDLGTVLWERDGVTEQTLENLRRNLSKSLFSIEVIQDAKTPHPPMGMHAHPRACMDTDSTL